MPRVAAAAALALACRYDNPPVTREIVWADAETEALARRACYDCHSNETAWPWYAWSPILGSFVTRDVHRGRCDVNFSEWDRPNEDALAGPALVRSGEMPLALYTVTHRDARLTPAEREALADGLHRTFDADPPVLGEACAD